MNEMRGRGMQARKVSTEMRGNNAANQKNAVNKGKQTV
jgi:hypothetical protein